MLLYRLRAVDATHASQIVEIELEGLDEHQARAEAVSRGLSVLSIQIVERASSARARARAKHWRSQDLAWWCRELRTLIAAGMTVVEALETLQVQSQGRSDERQAVQSGLLASLHRGQPLSQSMEELQCFPSVLVASVRAAERTSSLSGALDDYLSYHEMLDQMRRRVISAAMYPLLVASVGIVICIFLLTVVMPRFLGFLEGTQAVHSGVTWLLFSLSHWLNMHGALTLGMFGALMTVGVWSWRSGALAVIARRLAMAVPPIARVVQSFELAQLFQALSLLYRGGYPIEEAVGVCAAAADARGAGMTQQLALARQCLVRGEGLSRALTEAGLTDEVSRRLLAVGERSGGIDGILQAIAERHSQTVSDFVERAMRVVEPVLLLIVASLVGSVVVLMYLPIFEIATSLPS